MNRTINADALLMQTSALWYGVRPKNRGFKSKNYFYLFRFEIFMYEYASREKQLLDLDGQKKYPIDSIH